MQEQIVSRMSRALFRDYALSRREGEDPHPKDYLFEIHPGYAWSEMRLQCSPMSLHVGGPDAQYVNGVKLSVTEEVPPDTYRLKKHGVEIWRHTMGASPE